MSSGAVITIGGLVLIPAPGPGWLIVFLGLAVLASEFEWADRLLGYARHQVGRWTDWAGRQSLVVRLLLGLATLVLLVGAALGHAAADRRAGLRPGLVGAVLERSAWLAPDRIRSLLRAGRTRSFRSAPARGRLAQW